MEAQTRFNGLPPVLDGSHSPVFSARPGSSPGLPWRFVKVSKAFYPRSGQETIDVNTAFDTECWLFHFLMLVSQSNSGWLSTRDCDLILMSLQPIQKNLSY